MTERRAYDPNIRMVEQINNNQINEGLNEGINEWIVNSYKKLINEQVLRYGWINERSID